jgi:hypothetical protein
MHNDARLVLPRAWCCRAPAVAACLLQSIGHSVGLGGQPRSELVHSRWT